MNMEWPFLLLGVIVLASLAVYFRPKSANKSVVESMLEQSKQDVEQDPFEALNYSESSTAVPQGLTDDGWLRFYTVNTQHWFGHDLFQTLTSLGLQLDSNQCLVCPQNGKAAFRIIKIRI